MTDKLIRQHRMMRCEQCGQIFKLAHRMAGEEVDGVLRLALPIPCPRCTRVAKHAVAGVRGWAGSRSGGRGGRPYTGKGERVQSSMRWDAENHKFLNDLSHESGLSVADLVNEFVRIFREDAPMRNEVVGRLHEAAESHIE